MTKTAQQITELIGSTPLLRLNKYSAERGIATPIVAKLEMFNPGGSVKDRVAMAMIADAEGKGRLAPGGTIVEPTSGNTGVGLAMVAAVKGYRLILTMPETMSVERRRLVKAYGAEVVLTPGSEGMAGAIRKADQIRVNTPGAITLQQFDNPANPDIHYRTTGPEVWCQTEGKIDVLVAGVGTGGTLSGTARYLKEQNPAIRIVAVEPDASPVLSGGSPAPHNIQGIGAGFVPANYNAGIADEVVRVADSNAITAGRRLAATEGLLVGISSGAAAWAAAEVAGRSGYEGKTVVAILPDTGERYLSTLLFDNESHPL